ncbi:MAG TPA: DNA translocase FtsK 4TM domain-containing protein, partial [Planctomycetota bacterium]|nr:DNA translocase FtsK 4TM domain-containing protein [Planctomycetota bacterium]
MSSENTRESTAVVTGLGLVCLALFSGVSLYTHSPYDVMDYHALESSEISNSAGLVGAQLAHYAFCMYGAGAWVITLLMLVFGSVMCATRSMSGIWSRVLGGALLTAVVCAWCGALDKPGTASSYAAGSGGLLGGTFLAPPLIGYFGRVGIFLVLAAASMLACLLLAQTLTESLLSMVGRGVVRGGHALIDLILGKMPQANPVVPAQPAMALGNGSSVRMPRVAI